MGGVRCFCDCIGMNKSDMSPMVHFRVVVPDDYSQVLRVRGLVDC